MNGERAKSIDAWRIVAVVSVAVSLVLGAVLLHVLVGKSSDERDRETEIELRRAQYELKLAEEEAATR